ncbi:late embryogenesis abundant protein, variant [Pyricularia oryzae 70-15]|uniref:Late embryogenesis abundant protein, variant n=1 Tax=Pyricularia oryzae (strain 70-15 / ATCC MYA-4617 / FGSC 8958) TaxID=242507 RepID=G4MMJ4_PYRO7|nr:late embryogenesis abundant protein, variant [Pyricularia oryzae 70-15]EHA56972.1 late embryogenesis abundant protein, variant [Pyricularia oryzae 70-15]
MAEVAQSVTSSPWEKTTKDNGANNNKDQEEYFREIKASDKSQAQSEIGSKKDAASEVADETKKDLPTDDDDQVPAEELTPEDAVDSRSRVDSKVDSKVDPEGEADGDSGVDMDKHDLDEVEPEPMSETSTERIKKAAEDGSSNNPLAALDEDKSALGKVTGQLGDATEPVTETAQEATSKVGDVAKEGGSKVGEVTSKVGEATGLVGSQAGEATSQVDSKLGEGEQKLGETTEAGEEKLGETTEASEEKLGETTEAGEEKLGETTEAGEEKLDEAGEKIEEAGEKIEEEADKVDFSILKGGKVNKGGNVVNSDGKVIGRIKEGVMAHLVGKRTDEEGAIWNDSGEIIGRAEPIPKDELETMTKESGPFEAFPDATVNAKGMVVFNEEEIGKVIEGDIKKLRGMKVDPDGDILDRSGNVVGKAERWEPEPEPEAEPEPEVDRSILAGKRVNKAGNVVDSSGTIFGRVVEGDPKRMIGRMCDKKGNILSESGDVIGRAEIVTEGEREGSKEGPFAELQGLTVRKDGMVITPGGDVVGHLTKGDGKTLAGRGVDEDGDVCDKNGNVLGHAERYEEPEVEKKKNPLSGRRVNKEGNVVDADGNLVGKLTSGNLSICSGKEIDDDGDVVDGKGTTIGHVSLLEDIPPEPVEEQSPEDKAKEEQAEKDKELAKKMSMLIEGVLEKVKPICAMINSKIEKAERTPKDELDEEALVRDVRPLIEEGGKILSEANGGIRGLDPDGRIQANAKHKTASREATPEEYHLADNLKELTGTVTKCIDDAKKKLEGMPHAKKELNPLWGLLSEPLFQILAAVGLLLNGVLGLVGQLLSGLGLGGLVDGLLGGLGIKKILAGFGLGSLTDSLTGQNQKKKSGGGGGGLLGGVLG